MSTIGYFQPPIYEHVQIQGCNQDFFRTGKVLAKKGTIFVSSFCKQKIRSYAVYSRHIGLFRQCQCISIIDNFFKFWAIYIFLDKSKKQVFNVIMTYRCHHGWHQRKFLHF